MQTRRDFAISLGLARPGKGRLSREATVAVQKALAEGVQFSDCDSQGVRKPVEPEENEFGVLYEPPREYPPIPELPVNHDIDQVWALISIGKRYVPVAVTICGCHGWHVKFCSSDIPQLPTYLGGGLALMERPHEQT